MKITVHELLGMIKDDKAPKKIKYDDRIWVKNSKNNDYTDTFGNEFFDSYLILAIIDDIVEILDKIEEKKIPEKLGYFDLTKDKNEKDENGNDLELHYTGVADTFDIVYEKINEIIDYLKSKGE